MNEDRESWRICAAALMTRPGQLISYAAQMADEMLAEEKKRFPDGPAYWKMLSDEKPPVFSLDDLRKLLAAVRTALAEHKVVMGNEEAALINALQPFNSVA